MIAGDQNQGKTPGLKIHLTWDPIEFSYNSLPHI